MSRFLSGIQASARQKARAAALSAALGVAGLLFGLAGLGCLTAALWIAVANHYGTVVAFTLIGMICVALGAVFVALAARSPRHSSQQSAHLSGPHHPRPAREAFVQIAEGFAIGMQAGRAARGLRR